MGQKVRPTGFRVSRNKKWRSTWYATKQEFAKLLLEDKAIREYLMKQASCQGTSRITIKRMADKVEVTVHTARPGLTIGKKGAEIDRLKAILRKMTGKDVWIEVDEIKRADLEAELVGVNIARQLERRIPFRRAVKRAVQQSMDAGALGIKVRVGGRLGGAEIARAESYKDGQIPLHTLKADIDYAHVEAQTTYGKIGVKVWINRGEDILPAAIKRGS